MQKELAIVGFPRCGTSTLLRALDRHERVTMIAESRDRPESPLPLLARLRDPAPTGGIKAHKFAAQVFVKANLYALHDLNPDMITVLCYRDPLKALMSWHNMHRTIAASEVPVAHFAYEERDFYATCSVADYYRKFAVDLLKYETFLRRLLHVFPPGQIVVVPQEEMARNLPAVAGALVDYVETGCARCPVAAATATRHLGFADGHEIEIPESIRSELAGNLDRFEQKVALNRIFRISVMAPDAATQGA